MTITDIIEEIKTEITGGILELEIEDSEIELVIKKALREIERYWDETTMITIPFSSCIDYSTCDEFKEKVSSIVKIYRTEGFGSSAEDGWNDPLFMQQWQIFSGAGSIYNLNDYMLNYAAWNSLLQIKNTMSTDLAFKEDRHNNKLYINCAMDKPRMITIEYVPKLTSVEAIRSDYWIDILIKMSTALTKIVLGRIRTRFTQSNALWSQDGEKLLEEGNTELKELREILRANSNLIFPVD